MDDPNITMEEYIRLEEEKACRNGKEALSYEPTVSLLNNNEIDFRITFDESDDKDYMVIFNKNSFSYKIIYVNDSKTDSENDNEICLRFCQTSLRPQHIDEFDLKDETSLSKYDEEEQNVLYFNDLFPFNIIYPDDLNSNKDNDDNEVNIIQSSGALGLHTAEEMKSARFGAYWAESARKIPNKGGLSTYWVMISSAGDFLGIAPSYTSIMDPMLRLCHMLIACNIAGRSQAPKKLFTSGRKHGVMISGDLPMINMAELVAAAGALEVAEGALDVDKGDHAVSVLVQAPQPPASGPARTMA
ncbi:hypothetical protein Tco_0596091 [Tanacetum coccineum]